VSLAIEVKGIEKTFVKKRSLRELVKHPFRRAERIKALHGVDLEVERGHIFGLLGPNGAGKTTLLKILSCLVIPDVGYAKVGGIDTRRENKVKPQIGLVHSDERSFYWRLTGEENLRFFARLYNLRGAEIEPRIRSLLELVEMSYAADRAFSGYSSGMKQRLAIARALLHDPPILYMDEPTRSLDPAASLSLRRFVLDQLRDRDNKTIILATHNLQEAQAMSDRVAILVKGRVRQIGTVDQVRRWGLEGQRYKLEMEAGGGEIRGPFEVVDDHTVEGLRTVTVSLASTDGFQPMMRSLVESGVKITACDRDESDLERAFERILEADEADEA
jgi:ABC-2 type transport system ATP-binding protein